MLREPGKQPNNFTSSGSDFSISELINDALVGGARRPPSSVTQPGWRLQQVGTRQDRPRLGSCIRLLQPKCTFRIYDAGPFEILRDTGYWQI